MWSSRYRRGHASIDRLECAADVVRFLVVPFQLLFLLGQFDPVLANVADEVAGHCFHGVTPLWALSDGEPGDIRCVLGVGSEALEILLVVLEQVLLVGVGNDTFVSDVGAEDRILLISFSASDAGTR